MPKLKDDEATLSVGEFQQRCKMLAVKLAGQIGLSQGGLAFASTIEDRIADLKLAGRESEMIARNRGGGHQVVRLCHLSDDIFAWTGYFERWKRESNEQKFRFLSGGFTLHVGRPGDLIKPQVLRSEWVSPRSQGFAIDAGHPHWQMDVLESVRAEKSQPSARFAPDFEESAPKDFSAATATDPQDFLLRLGIERMHFASAAVWWPATGAAVSYAPANAAELDRWVLGCAAYLQQEFKRCVIHPLR